jgi:hypothetical protein
MGTRPTSGLIGTKYILPALSDYTSSYSGASSIAGVDIALELITQRATPSWGYMLEQGPGTLWEQFQ